MDEVDIECYADLPSVRQDTGSGYDDQGLQVWLNFFSSGHSQLSQNQTNGQ